MSLSASVAVCACLIVLIRRCVYVCVCVRLHCAECVCTVWCVCEGAVSVLVGVCAGQLVLAQSWLTALEECPLHTVQL